MPLTLTLTEGVIPAGAEQATFSRLSDLMMKLHGIHGNTFMTPNVVGSINLIPQGLTFSGADPKPVVFIEWKVPSFVFADRDIQTAYIREATDIVIAASGGRHPKELIWVNVTHAVDGAWGVAGEALTNTDRVNAVGAAAQAQAA